MANVFVVKGSMVVSIRKDIGDTQYLAKVFWKETNERTEKETLCLVSFIGTMDECLGMVSNTVYKYKLV